MQKRFETIIQVRPSDLDLNFHVHYPKYLEYILLARFDQMERCYRYPMARFVEKGLSWVVKRTLLNFHAPVLPGDEIRVATWIEEMVGPDCRIGVEVRKRDRAPLDGEIVFSLVNGRTGAPVPIPPDVRDHFLSFREA